MPLKATGSAFSFKNPEEFIEKRYPVDISGTFTINCQVTQSGWRPAPLRDMLRTGSLLLPNKDLDFTITECSVPAPYQ